MGSQELDKASNVTNDKVEEAASAKASRVAEDDLQDQPESKRSKRQRDDKPTEWGPRLDENGNPVPKSERRPKKKVACMIGYCGTGYNGMQIQNNPDVKTIENDIFQAFIKAGAVSPENSLDLKKNGFMRAARTDKGVHAAGNVISCKLIIEDEDILEKINANLPSQIRVWGIERTNKSFDCRKMCSSRPSFIAENKKAHPGVSRDDEEGDKWWEETLQTIMKEGNISQEDIFLIQTKVNDTSNPANSNNNEDAEVENLMKMEN
ncbi:hypothetical protein QCA50_017418 [Cerrena zonata]|uniref:Uncharacterized protein n=1 Tax=Cerrena zonata TaxID=2478898 RepID=A0AAW0FJL1_9APHY